jgi:tetratricopeptide (TPR) repeat protein
VLRLVLMGLGLLAWEPAHALQRFAVLVGANTGWEQDLSLRHAVRDAHKMRALLEQMGGFAPEDILLLEEPTTEELRGVLDWVAARTAGVTGESLFLFYYSGHADQTSLHLRGQPLGLKELSGRIEALPPLLKLGILDACQSGAILTKGGRPAPSFTVEVRDELALRGLVFLTSSGAKELSQEAGALEGSIFSHHLLSGLRGAADENEDGQVSLDEAYRHAYARTQQDTASSPHGVQRPQKRFDLRGQGEVILTRLEEAAATVRFPPSRKRCFIDDAAKRRLAEVPARPQEGTWLGLEAGEYALRCVEAGQEDVVRFAVASGVQAEVSGLVLKEGPRALRARARAAGTLAPRGSLKHQAFALLAKGQAEEALQVFEQALREDRRDQQAFEGKAWTLLALADEAQRWGRPEVAARLQAAAVLAWPSIEEELKTRSLEREE